MSIGFRTRGLVSAAAVIVLLSTAACGSNDPVADTSSSSGVTDSSMIGETAEISSGSATASATASAPVASSSAAGPAETTASVAPVTTTTEPTRTTTITPKPGSGNINQTVPSKVLPSNPPVELTQTAQFGGGVTVNLVSIQQIQTVAQGPGEVSGPGLAVTISIKNASNTAISLAAVNVTLGDALDTPGSPMAGDPSKPFSGELAAGAATSGVYVFALPPDYKDPASISVSYSTDAPIVYFTGNAK